MLAFITAVIAGACLAAGWAFDQAPLLSVAIGSAGAGLLLFCAEAGLRWNAARTDVRQVLPEAKNPG